ncbi:MAG TPA: hypothetical protein VEB60_00895, partial [Candidatus Paceibacterota bacterium]|nr:hypothetical protein [Candidatus Paceibacterota bacterium]
RTEGNTSGVLATLDARWNWWGSNAGPGGCGGAFGSGIDASQHLVMSLSANPAYLTEGEPMTVVADFSKDNLGMIHPDVWFAGDKTVWFNVADDHGWFSPNPGRTVSGRSESVFHLGGNFSSVSVSVTANCDCETVGPLELRQRSGVSDWQLYD